MTDPDSVASPLASPTYVVRLMNHLRSRIETVPRTRGESYEPVRLEDLVHPAARWAWDEIDRRGKLHKFARHVRSSQTFAVNLFGGLPEAGITEILASFFGPISQVDRPDFEFEDESDRLRESIPRGQRTQVDVVLRGRTAAGRNVALLIEVKLSETDFGNCSGADDPNNDAKDVCDSVGPFGSDADRCYKLRNHGDGQRRLYDRYLNLNDTQIDSHFGGCWFRTSGYQPMRNVAMAEMLRQEEGTLTQVAVCAPFLHRSLWAHFDRVRKVLPRGSIVPLPAELVASLHPEESFRFINDRYFFETESAAPGEEAIEVAAWQIISCLDESFEHRLRLFETQPGGGQYDCITLAEIIDGRPVVRVDLNRTGRIHVHCGEILSLDGAWQSAMAGDAVGVAKIIGESLGLKPRAAATESAWRFFERTIRLGRSAGETLRWKNDTNEDSSFMDSPRFLPDWRLERFGSNYHGTGLPRTVFEGKTGRTL